MVQCLIYFVRFNLFNSTHDKIVQFSNGHPIFYISQLIFIIVHCEILRAAQIFHLFPDTLRNYVCIYRSAQDRHKYIE